MKARTHFDKIWDGHVVPAELGCSSVLCIDLHLIHKVTTVCNMSIKAGARAGMIAPDDTIFEYLHRKTFVPAGAEWRAPRCGMCIAMNGDELAALG